MKTLKIGIMPKEVYQQRALDVVNGKNKLKANEPKIWFSSVKSLAEVLSDNNIRLLKLIDENKPESIKELAELSGRKSSNLSRTLHTMERYGIVTLKKTSHIRGLKPIANATHFDIQLGAYF